MSPLQNSGCMLPIPVCVCVCVYAALSSSAGGLELLA